MSNLNSINSIIGDPLTLQYSCLTLTLKYYWWPFISDPNFTVLVVTLYSAVLLVTLSFHNALFLTCLYIKQTVNISVYAVAQHERENQEIMCRVGMLQVWREVVLCAYQHLRR